MLYELEQGEHEQSIIDQHEKEGLPLPDKIQNAPTLLPGLGLFYKAFMSLTSTRQIGMGLGPIPWNIIQDYCRECELDEEQTEAMHYHIAHMDGAFLEHQSKKQKKHGNSTPIQQKD